jgi:hypothetical protein
MSGKPSKPRRNPAKDVTDATRVTGHTARAERTVALATADVLKGNPATYVIGKPDEKPARKHAPLPPKRKRPTAKTVLADIRLRRQELEPVVRGVAELEAALEALRDI